MHGHGRKVLNSPECLGQNGRSMLLKWYLNEFTCIAKRLFYITDIENSCSEDKQERDRFISLVSAVEVWWCQVVEIFIYCKKNYS